MDVSVELMDQAHGQKNTVSEITTIFTDLYVRFAELRAAQIKGYRYAAGKMIDDDILKELKKQRRPALIFRLLHKQLLFMNGMLRSEQRRMRAVPLRMGDEDLSDLHTVLVGDWAMNACNGYDQIARAGMDAVIARIGWLNHFWSTRFDPEGQPIVRSEDPLSFVWDLDAQQTDQSDWRYMGKHGLYSCDELIQIYRKSLSEEMIAKMRERDQMLQGRAAQVMGRPVGLWNRLLTGFDRAFRSGTPSSAHDRTELLNDLLDAKNGMYRVIEWHDRRTTVAKFAYSPLTGSMEQIPPKLEGDRDYEAAALARHPAGQIMTTEHEDLWITPIVPSLLESEPLFEAPYQTQERGFQYKPIFCYDFTRDMTEASSLVDILATANDFTNQRLMSLLEAGMDVVNPPIDYPEGSITKLQRPAWESKERGVLREFSALPDGSGPKARTIGAEGFQVLKVLSDEGKQMVQDLGGLTPNLQGYSETANEPAALYRQRVEQGMVMLAGFFANLHQAMKASFGYTDALIQQFLTFERMVRLLDEPPAGMPGVAMVGKSFWLMVNQQTVMGVKNDLSQGKYDFLPDTESIGKTAKQQKFLETMELVKITPPELVLWPKLFELHDSPAAKDMAEFASRQMGAMLEREAAQAAIAGANARVDLANKAAAPAGAPKAA